MIKESSISEWIELVKKYKYYVIFNEKTGLIGYTNSKSERNYWKFRKSLNKKGK